MIPQTKCKSRKDHRATYKVHDGTYPLGRLTARCAIISVQLKDWQEVSACATTTCHRCLKMRKLIAPSS